MSMNSSQAFGAAVEIVKAGLTSGSIKLLGASTGSANVTNSTEDSKYVNALINAIATNLKSSA